MIEQRVRLSAKAHRAIAQAQKVLNLARFEDALGFYLEGSIATATGGRVAVRMFEGMRKLRKQAKR